jgi:hypothetical protein
VPLGGGPVGSIPLNQLGKRRRIVVHTFSSAGRRRYFVTCRPKATNSIL